MAPVQVQLNLPALVQPQLPPKIEGFSDRCAKSKEITPVHDSLDGNHLKQIPQNYPYLCLCRGVDMVKVRCMSVSTSVSQQGFG